jgi:hypothetical protein
MNEYHSTTENRISEDWENFGVLPWKRKMLHCWKDTVKKSGSYKSKIAYMIHGRSDSQAMQITYAGRFSGPGQTPRRTVPSANLPCHQGQVWCYPVDFFE